MSFSDTMQPVWPCASWACGATASHSFIAPHSLTARALVVAPDDVLTVHNRSADPVDVSLDGRPAGELAPGATITCAFLRDVTQLALLPGSTFYRRLRETFGRLSS